MLVLKKTFLQKKDGSNWLEKEKNKTRTQALPLGIPLDEGLAHMHFVYYSTSFQQEESCNVAKMGTQAAQGPCRENSKEWGLARSRSLQLVLSVPFSFRCPFSREGGVGGGGDDYIQ